MQMELQTFNTSENRANINSETSSVDANQVQDNF